METEKAKLKQPSLSTLFLMSLIEFHILYKPNQLHFFINQLANDLVYLLLDATLILAQIE